MLVTFFLWVKKFCLKRKTNHDISSLFIKLVDSGKDYLVPVSGKVPVMLRKTYTKNAHIPETCQWYYRIAQGGNYIFHLLVKDSSL